MEVFRVIPGSARMDRLCVVCTEYPVALEGILEMGPPKEPSNDSPDRLLEGLWPMALSLTDRRPFFRALCADEVDLFRCRGEC